MTQEDKELLLKDLCARLPYGVKVQYKGNVYDLKEMHKDGRTYLGSYKSIYGDWHCSLEFEDYPKPYLRPMSSMTEEEKKEYYTFQYKFTLQTHEYQELNKETFSEYLDWLNKKMFAYRTIDGKDMFELELALEAPEGLYD